MFDIKRFRKDLKLKQEDLAQILGVPQSFISQVENGKDQMPYKWIDVLKETHTSDELNKYVIEDSFELKKANKIPFYDDVITIGGASSMLAEQSAVYRPAEYVDAGDWFKDATAALRHYGESMIEYPTGCILALRDVKDKSLLVWGKNYVIETSEYRITKRVQRGKHEGFITAYSSNTETYPDGRLVHEPLDIPVDAARFSLVLGYVVKQNGGSMIYSKP